jgi:hypothetical protein
MVCCSLDYSQILKEKEGCYMDASSTRYLIVVLKIGFKLKGKKFPVQKTIFSSFTVCSRVPD